MKISPAFRKSLGSLMSPSSEVAPRHVGFAQMRNLVEDSLAVVAGGKVGLFFAPEREFLHSLKPVLHRSRICCCGDVS
jgi:hypothetical protein